MAKRTLRVVVAAIGAVGDAVVAELGARGHTVSRVADGEDAARALAWRPHLVILDRGIPGAEAVERALEPPHEATRLLAFDDATPTSAIIAAVLIELR